MPIQEKEVCVDIFEFDGDPEGCLAVNGCEKFSKGECAGKKCLDYADPYQGDDFFELRDG